MLRGVSYENIRNAETQKCISFHFWYTIFKDIIKNVVQKISLPHLFSNLLKLNCEKLEVLDIILILERELFLLS